MCVSARARIRNKERSIYTLQWFPKREILNIFSSKTKSAQISRNVSRCHVGNLN